MPALAHMERPDPLCANGGADVRFDDFVTTIGFIMSTCNTQTAVRTACVGAWRARTTLACLF